MADFVLNDAKGRIAEKAAGGADFVIIPMSAIDTQANLEDAYAGGSMIDDVLGDAANTEQTGSTWARYNIANGSVTETIDDTGNKVTITIPDTTWTAPLTGNDTVSLLFAEDVTVDADSPVLTHHDFPVTTDGNDVTADFPLAATGLWSAA